MSVGVLLFTRHLRLHDNPVLWHAVHSHLTIRNRWWTLPRPTFLRTRGKR